MSINFQYYYNNVPNKGLCRNNLIYTSLISQNQTVFCQWFHNDTDYHKGQNQVVDPSLMDLKFRHEIRGLKYMYDQGFKDLIPEFEIDSQEKKVYLKIDGPDMWEQAGCQGQDYSQVLKDWDQQMLDIFRAHHSIGLYKYSLHPSSYFVVKGKLKSMNYFFSYLKGVDEPISLASVMSHISEDRQADLFPKMKAAGIEVDKPQDFCKIQLLAFDSFKNNFRNDVMESAKKIYV